MTSRRRVLSVAALTVIGAGFGGCQNQRIDRLEQLNQTSAARIEQLNQEVSTLETTVSRKQGRINELEAEVSGLRGVRTDLEAEIGDVRAQQSSIQDRLGNLRLVTLDPETDRALQQLAADNSNLIRYDPAQGMIMFTSDLTFSSGSDEVQSQAREGLTKLAQIMTNSRATGYDLRIVGHTDNQRMSNPATIQRFHSNRHLSFFRAAAVERILRQSGMPGDRLETVGWGEYRPVMANNARGGTSANRRVEIFVVPTSATMGGSMQADVDPASEDTTTGRMPMK